MKRYLLLAVLWLFAPVAWGQGLSISNAWIRLLPGQLPAGAYCDIANAGEQSAVITGVASPVFEKAMLHRSVTRNGVEQMVHVRRVVVRAGQTFHFKPGGYHIMLMPPHRPLKPGDSVPVSFRLADGHRLNANFAVRGAAATDD